MESMQNLYYDYMASPIGNLLLAGDGESLVQIGFPAGKAALRHQPDWVHDRSLFLQVKEQLREYFAGELREFTVPLAPRGTDFQLQVWIALRSIPYGERISYGELASQIGRPKASRAVGSANGRNPLPIIIPCHRVVGSSGALVGFGGGLEAKQALLELERKVVEGRRFSGQAEKPSIQ